MVHVPNRPHVHVRLRPLKLALCHVASSVPKWNDVISAVVPMARIERATSPLPRECSATELHGQAPAPRRSVRTQQTVQRSPQLARMNRLVHTSRKLERVKGIEPSS